MGRPVTGDAALPPWAASARYLALTTFRSSGAPVTTPVWFAKDGERLLVWTGAAAGKARRIRANKAVTVASCSMRGQVRTAPVEGVARLLSAHEGQLAHDLLNAKYRLTKRLYDLYLRARRTRARRPAEGSAYIEIRVQPPQA